MAEPNTWAHVSSLIPMDRFAPARTANGTSETPYNQTIQAAVAWLLLLGR